MGDVASRVPRGFRGQKEAMKLIEVVLVLLASKVWVKGSPWGRRAVVYDGFWGCNVGICEGEGYRRCNGGV